MNVLLSPEVEEQLNDAALQTGKTRESQMRLAIISSKICMMLGPPKNA